MEVLIFVTYSAIVVFSLMLGLHVRKLRKYLVSEREESKFWYDQTVAAIDRNHRLYRKFILANRDLVGLEDRLRRARQRDLKRKARATLPRTEDGVRVPLWMSDRLYWNSLQALNVEHMVNYAVHTSSKPSFELSEGELAEIRRRELATALREPQRLRLPINGPRGFLP